MLYLHYKPIMLSLGMYVRSEFWSSTKTFMFVTVLFQKLNVKVNKLTLFNSQRTLKSENLDS